MACGRLLAQRQRNFVDDMGDLLCFGINGMHGLTGPFGHVQAGIHLLNGVFHPLRHAATALLNGAHHAGDFLRRTGRALGQFPHFVGDDSKTASHFSGTRRFDGRVERQQIGLIGHPLDDVDDAADALRFLPQLACVFGALADGL